MLKKLFILGVIAIPFTGFYAFLPIGELQNELSFYIFSLAMVVGVLAHVHTRQITSGAYKGPEHIYLLTNIMLWTFGIIGFSFVMNCPNIVTDQFRGRTAIDKFTTSTLVLAYGFGLAYLSYFLGDKYSWHEIIIWPIAISVVICAVVAGLEMMSWYSGAVDKIYDPLSKFLHTMDTEAEKFLTMEDWADVGRARSVTFEAPSLSNYANFAWPWIYTGMHSASKKRRPLYFATLILCTLLIIVSWSRTSIVLFGGNMIVLLLLRYIYLPSRLLEPLLPKAVSIIITGLSVLLLAAIILNHDVITDYVVNGKSVSNITRYASMMAGFRMFPDSPVWGHGFGQYGFYLIHYIPDWGYSSYEIAAWVVNPAAGWPPVFSIYARFAAELGLVGLIAWTGFWIWLGRHIWIVTLAYQRATGQLLLFAYPLIMTCYCVLLAGVSLDSLRTPMMWISLGLSCCYIFDVRVRLAKIGRSEAAPALS